jgi:hypothetical protein
MKLGLLIGLDRRYLGPQDECRMPIFVIRRREISVCRSACVYAAVRRLVSSSLRAPEVSFSSAFTHKEQEWTVSTPFFGGLRSLSK